MTTEIDVSTVITLIREMTRTMQDYEYQKGNATYYYERVGKLEDRNAELKEEIAQLKRKLADFCFVPEEQRGIVV